MGNANKRDAHKKNRSPLKLRVEVFFGYYFGPTTNCLVGDVPGSDWYGNRVVGGSHPLVSCRLGFVGPDTS